MLQLDSRVPSVEQVLENPHLRPFVLNADGVVPEKSYPDDGVMNFRYPLLEPLCSEDFFKKLEAPLDPKNWRIVRVDADSREYKYSDELGKWNSRKTILVRYEPESSLVRITQR